MKPNNLKKQRRKIVPLCYQKQNLSKSNSSISQLLCIGAYKKRINELVRNNRSLAVTLQEARCETAYQSSILQDYARDGNQIRSARLKLQGMAKTITKLVTDLHEVLNCLDVDWTSDRHNLPQKNRHHEKMKLKVPTVDCIEEVSVLSSENEEYARSGVSEPSAASNKVASHPGEINEVQPVPSKCIVDLADDPDTPPVLFIEDSEDNHMERPSRKSKSSRKCILIGQTSLTPELDIDFPSVMRKSSNSRRQTQLIPSAPSSGRSSRKSYCNQTSSAESATPNRSLLPSDSILNRKLSSTLMDCEQLSEDKNIPEFHCEQSSERNKIPECPFINMKKRGGEEANSSPPNVQYTSKHITGHLNMPSNVPQTVVPGTAVSSNENTELNHTILFNDDMELTEILRPVQQITSGSSPTAVVFPLGTTDVQLSVPEKNKLNTSVKKTFCNDKLTENSERVAVSSKDMHLNEMENESRDSIINDKICKNSETFQHLESPNKKHSVSPTKRSSRNKKTKMYKVFFSSSESESDSTPIKSEVKQNKSHKIKRDTVIFKPKSGRRASHRKDNNESSEKCPLKELHGKKESQNSFSVYDLDVSNSKKPAKKSKPKSKTKNSSHNKEISKPLLQNCSVTKLQGINYKFSKTESFLSKVKENQLLQNCNSLLEVNPTVSTEETIEKNQLNLSSDNVEEDSDARIESRQSVNSPGGEISTSKLIDFQHQEINTARKSEIKRVSFAPADVICTFTKTSVSRTIADNKKKQHASKSVFEGLSNQESSRSKDFIQFETNKPSDDIPEAPPTSEELFNSEETELYTFMLPSDTLQNTTKVDEHTSPKTTVSSVTVPSTFYDIHDNQNSKQCKLAVKQKLGKLSLKGNNSQKNVQPQTLGKIDKDILSMPLQSLSPVIQPKKSKLSHDDLKENIMHTNPQTLNMSKAEIKSQSKTFKSHLPPVKDNMPIPVDDIKTVVKSSCKRDNLSHKQDLCQPTPDKRSKKSSNRRKFEESSPVLKDVMNLEAKEENRESMKRRSKVISYKEPALNKKLRR